MSETIIAFDTVCHKALVFKMDYLDVPIALIKIIISYLSKRKFIVDYDGVLSNSMEIVAGVPQGSVFGPLLFLIYINDIPNYHDNTVALFADDTTVVANSGSHKLLCQKTQDHFELLNKYFMKWKIKINEQKIELLIVNRNITNTTINISTNGQKITSVHSVKYLGIIIDSQLNFKKHITTVVAKAKAALCMLYRFIKNKNITIKNKVLIYKTCIRPVMTYACPVWCNSKKSNIKKMQTVQNKCLNIILDNHYYDGNNHFMNTIKCHKKS